MRDPQEGDGERPVWLRLHQQPRRSDPQRRTDQGIEARLCAAPLARAGAAAVLCLAILCASAAGCTRAPARPHESLTAGAEPLRTAFNRDAGKPRIVILAAPT
jgi:hypothetical protein